MTWQPDSAPVADPARTPAAPTNGVTAEPTHPLPNGSPSPASSPTSPDADLGALLAGRPTGSAGPNGMPGMPAGGKVGRIMLLAVGVLVVLIGAVAAAWFVIPGFRQP